MYLNRLSEKVQVQAFLLSLELTPIPLPLLASIM